MKLTFLGHASWLVQSANASLVTDLLVENFFRNGTFTICPTRELDIDAMPKLDALVITHRHRDHFDLETLLRLDRHTKILCPKDKVILQALDRFGYENVEQFSDWSHHTVGDLELIFTPSDNRVPENGVLITEGDTVFWNHVDTVISAKTIEIIRDKVGEIDLVAHGYQPMLETAALESLATLFPAAMYAGLLHRAKLLSPRALAPGSNGYRTAGKQAWFNKYKFPVSRERFVRDIESLMPETETFIPNPGDVMELTAVGMKTARQAAPNDFVRTVVDDAAELMAFDPAADKPALEDENTSKLSGTELREMVRIIFETRIPEGCRTKITRFHALRMFEALLEVRVVYPDGSMEPWIVDLSGDEPRVTLGSRGDETDVVMTVGASSLHDLATGRTRPDVIALSGQFRVFSRAYRIEGARLVLVNDIAPAGVHRQRDGMPWLLFTLIGFEADFEARQVDAEIDRLLEDTTYAGKPLWDRPPPRPLSQRLATPPPGTRVAFAEATGALDPSAGAAPDEASEGGA
jgi:UDP-MurNAc hydroxylase